MSLLISSAPMFSFDNPSIDPIKSVLSLRTTRIRRFRSEIQKIKGIKRIRRRGSLPISWGQSRKEIFIGVGIEKEAQSVSRRWC